MPVLDFVQDEVSRRDEAALLQNRGADGTGIPFGTPLITEKKQRKLRIRGDKEISR